MKIDRIELFHVSIPTPKPFYPAWIPGYPQTANRFTLLRLTTGDGATGHAAGIAFERERQGLGGLLGPYLIGADPTDIPTIRQRLREASFLGWRNYWIEAACWDILGKLQAKPVWQLLAGDGHTPPERLPVYASTGEVHPPRQRAEEALQLVAMGFTALKLRVHSFELAEDIAQLEAVRTAVGDDIQIGVDANQGWRVALVDDAPLWDLARASEFAAACADLGIAWIEEPLDMHAYDELAALRQRSKAPIAGGELNAGWHEFKVMLEKGSYNIYQPDATMGGGVTDAKTVLDACADRQLGFTPHTWTNGLGFLTNLHVFACSDCSQPIEYPYEPPGWVPEVRDGLLAEPLLADSTGTVPLPMTPGLGIELDEDKLHRYAEKFFEMTAGGLALKTVREKGLFTALRLRRKRSSRDTRS